MEQVRRRKIRSDKKKDVKPFVPIELSECISRVSYITNRPIKSVAEELCVKGIHSNKVIEKLSGKFKRDFIFSKYTMFIGDNTVDNDRTLKIKGNKKRVTIRFQQTFYERLNELAYALDMSPSSTVSLLLQHSIKDTELVNHLIRRYVAEELDEKRMQQLKEVYRFVRKENPYEDQFTFSMFISYLFDELKCTTETFANKVGHWLNNASE